MKKFLSLVLALVMTMSLVTISAGAKDFTDDSKLNYKEAVDVVSAIGVIDGYTDGSFNPQAGLTRGAAAKIICNLILGPTTAAALRADTAPFKDVAVDNTFAGYIAYCSQQGIISGYSDGTFRPAAPLTGYAFMKMLLGALGYDADIEGYVGANWSIQVAKRALAIGLDDGMVEDFVGSKAVNREEACLFAFNTLTADMVEYGQKTTITVGGAEVVVGASEAKKVEWNDTKDYRESVRDGDKKDNSLQFCEKYFSNLKLKDLSGITDAFGRPSNTWYKKNDKIGTYPKAADLTYNKSVKGKDIFADLGLDKADAYDYDVVIDGYEYTEALPVAKGTAGDVKLSSVADYVGDGSLVEVFEDEQVITVVNTYVMKVAGDYDEKDEVLNLEAATNDLCKPADRIGSVALSSDDFAGLDEFKDEDVVTVTVATADQGRTYEVKSIALAEKVTGTVAEYVDEESVTLDETYKYNVTALADGIDVYQYTIKSDVALYVDANGLVLFADGIEDEGSYVYIDDFSVHTSSSKSPIVAHAYFLDGTEEEITLNKVGTVKVAGLQTANSLDEGWYKFTKKDTGKYDLTWADEEVIGTDNDKVVTDYAAQKADLGDGEFFGNKETKFIVVDKNDNVKVYEGIKNMPKTVLGTNGVAKAILTTDTDYAKYVFIDVDDGNVKGGSISKDQLFVLKLDATYGHDNDADTYYRYKVILNGEETKVKVVAGTGIAVGQLYSNIEYNTKGYVTAIEPVDDPDYYYSCVEESHNVAGATFTYKSNTVVMTLANDTKVNFYMADNAKIYLINDKDDVSVVSGATLVREVNKIVDDDGNACGLLADSTVFAVKDNDTECTALYVYNYEA